MRLLRIVRSQVLPCGCLAGIYETYQGRSVAIIDEPGPACSDNTHRRGVRLDGGSGARAEREAPAARHAA